MIHFFKKIFTQNATCTKGSNSFKIQSFTYYIPSPPARDSGYREKQFDKIFYEFINLGYEILDFKIASNNGQKSSGIWMVFILRALNQEADAINLNEVVNNKSTGEESPEIEGLYYIDDRSQV